MDLQALAFWLFSGVMLIAAAIQFLINVQRLLDEGLFVATYKFALLLSLADLAIELGDDSGAG